MTRLASTHDLDARHGSKRSTHWTGYKCHLTESIHEDDLQLITQVTTTKASAHDSEALEEIQESLLKRDLKPDEMLLDKGYMTASSIEKSKRKHNIDLVGPVQSDGSWQAKEGKGFDSYSFQIDWVKKEATCPKGKKSSRWKKSNKAKEGKPNGWVDISFSGRECRECPVKVHCTKSESRGRTLQIHPQHERDALIRAKEFAQTDEYKNAYKARSGSEATVSEWARAGGRRTRYRGEAKVHLGNILTATAINLRRIANVLEGQTRRRTPHRYLSEALAA